MCKELRNGTTPSFRGYKEAADKKRELELFWTRCMKERVRNGSDEKREEALVQERKRIVSLQKLKEQGGPFTSAEEVDTYLSDLDETNKKEKQKRMKLEISYARDTSTVSQKVDPLFKIRKVDLKGKQRGTIRQLSLERRWQSSWAGRQTGGQWTIQHSRIA